MHPVRNGLETTTVTLEIRLDVPSGSDAIAAENPTNTRDLENIARQLKR
jgi:hypothetical protein